MSSYQYVIEGGFPLKGRITASGNKNSALPCLAATLLTDQPVVLRNLPDIEDVRVMIEILKVLGSAVEKIGHNEYRVHTLDILREEVPPHLALKIRASILLAGPLLARKGRVLLPPPGGDVIGRRPLDTHFLALMELGTRVESGTFFVLSADKLKGAQIFLDETSVTATENCLMAAVLAEGTTVIENAASEPHVQDLCRMLVSMGARITGIGSNILTVVGVKKLAGTDFRIGSDFMEVGSLIGLAAATRGDIEIEDAAPQNLRMMKLGFAKLGITWETSGETIHVPAVAGPEGRPDHGGTDPEDRRCPVARLPGGHHQHCPRGGDPGRGDGAHPREDVRVADVLRGQADRHGGTHHPLRSPPGRGHRALAPVRLRAGFTRRPRGHGHADCRHVCPGTQLHPERLPDRARLREPDAEAAVPGGPHFEKRECAP